MNKNKQYFKKIIMKKGLLILLILFTQAFAFSQDSKVSQIAKYISKDKWIDARELLDELDNNPKYKNDIHYWFVRTCYYKAAIATHINSDKDLYKVELFEAGKSLSKLIEFDGIDSSKSYSEYIPQFRKEIYKRADLGLNKPSNENISKFQKNQSSISYSDNTIQDNKAQSEKIIITSNNISKETANSDGSGKTVTLTEIGQGMTKDDAKYNALRNALEKAFGAFISSNTTILDDNLVKDEIVSISNGNIQNFKILSETQMPDGSYTSIVNATVSIGKLITYCESKGISIEFKGQLFAANIKLIELKRKNEIQVFKDLEKIILIITKKLFNYTVDAGEPIVFSNDLWKIPITINVRSNENLNKINDLLFSTIKSISATEDEIIDYEKKGVYLYEIEFNHEAYFFRNFESFNMLTGFFKHLDDRAQSLGYYKNSKNLYNSMLDFNLDNGIYSVNGVDIINEVDFRRISAMAQYERRDNINFKKVVEKKKIEKTGSFTTPSFFNIGEFSNPFSYSSCSDKRGGELGSFQIKLKTKEGGSYMLVSEIKFNYILKMSEIEKISQFTVTPIQ